MDILINTTIPTRLCEIMGRNKSDKGNLDITKCWHNYTLLYYSIFKDICDKKLKVFELGIGTTNTDIPCNMGKHGRHGASLYGWREFFVNSEIFGADIDKQILFTDDRIKTFFCDVRDVNSIISMWNNQDLSGKFDIIIDDGLHIFNDNITFFINSIDKLSENGYYIIEDIACYGEVMINMKSNLNNLRVMYPIYNFYYIVIPSITNVACDNSVLIVTKNKLNITFI